MKKALFGSLLFFFTFSSVSLAQEIDEKYRIDKTKASYKKKSDKEPLALINYTPVPIIFRNIRGGIVFQTETGRYHEIIAGAKIGILDTRNSNYIEYRYKMSKKNPKKKFNQAFVAIGGTISQYYVTNFPSAFGGSTTIVQYIGIGGMLDIGCLLPLRNLMYTDISIGFGVQYYSQADDFRPRFSEQDILFFINQEDSGFEPLYRIQLRHYIAIFKKNK